MSGGLGRKFREAVERERPLQVIGTINAYVALMAERCGYQALYLSGAGVANASYGLPDLGMTTLDNVLEDACRITDAVELPLLVDIDTGWGSPLMIARTIKQMCRASVAAVHIEDQLIDKRCGHRPGKALVSKAEMCDRIKAAVDAKLDPDFVVMARTDALAVEGLEATIDRCISYKEAGADMLFAEAIPDLNLYRTIKAQVELPLLANMTEFGKTPLYTTQELADAGVDLVLYPLSVTRIMNKAALEALASIRRDGTQIGLVKQMQTRDELYKMLDYHTMEKKQRL